MKTKITVMIEQEKLEAIQFYMDKKESSMDEEMEDFVQKLYEKVVPAQTREFIESKLQVQPEKPKREVKKATASLPTGENGAR
jgi:hypothetical protein